MRYLLLILLSLFSTFGFTQSFSVNQGQAISESMSHVPNIISIPVSGLPNVIDQSFGLASVCLNITHPELNNLTIKLVSPDGTKVTMFHQLGYTDDDLVNTCFDDQGPPIYLQSAPFTGTFRSTLPLGQVNNGQNPNGTWSLWIYDDWLSAGGSTGYFQGVTLNFNAMPAVPFSFQQSNLPIIEINTQNQVINNYTKALVEFKTFDQQSGVNDFLLDAPIYNAKALVEWQGWSSPGLPKKNFDIDLVDASGARVDFPLFGMPAENDWVLKGEFLDRTLIKNSLVFSLFERMGHYAPRIRLCEVVLDGEYIGVYTLQEKVKRNDERVKITALNPGELSPPSISGGYIFEMNPTGATPDWYSSYAPINDITTNYDVEFKLVYPKRQTIPSVQLQYLKAYTDSMEQAIAAPTYQDSTLGYRAFVDVYSFIDFMLLSEFSANYDTYGRSFYLVKEHQSDNGKIKAGPPWDFDRTFGYDWPSPYGWVWDITNYYWPFPFWWSRFWSDELYRKETECRWKSYRMEVLSDGTIQQVMDSLETRIAEAVLRNDAVWKDHSNISYATYRDSLHSWIAQRLAWMDDSLNQYNVSIPSIQNLSDTSVCAGDTLDFHLSNQYRYDWDPGPKSPILIPTESAVYTLTVIDTLGCFSRQSIAIEARKPNVDFEVSSTVGFNQVLFTAIDSSLSYYQWNLNQSFISQDVSCLATFPSNGIYIISLTSTDSTGCTWTEFKDIAIETIPVLTHSFTVFPNPTASGCWIYSNENLIGKSYIISDLLGKVVQEGVVLTPYFYVDIPWANGVYSLTIARETLKILKF